MTVLLDSGRALRYRRDRVFAMSAVPSADERYSFETDGFLVVESFLGWLVHQYCIEDNSIPGKDKWWSAMVGNRL